MMTDERGIQPKAEVLMTTQAVPRVKGSGDLEPLSLLVGSLIRRSWLIVLITVIAAGVTWTLSGSDVDTSSSTATSRIGLTEESTWPFYDVDLEAGRFLAASPEFRTELEDRLGYEVKTISGILPDELGVFDITVVADSGVRAANAANLAAEMVLEQSLASLNADVVDELAALDIEITDLEARIAELEAEVIATGQELTAIFNEQATNSDPALKEREFLALADRDSASVVKNDLERTLAEAVSFRASTASRVEVPPLYRIVRAAEVGGIDTSSSQLPVTLAVAFGAFLLACAAVVAIDRRVGSVRSSWQLANVCGAPVHSELRTDGQEISGAGGIADVIDLGLGDGLSVFGVIDATGVGISLDGLARSLELNGIFTSVASTPQQDPEALVTLVDVSNEYASEDVARQNSRACDGIILLVDSSTSMRRTAAIVARASTNPGMLSAAFVQKV